MSFTGRAIYDPYIFTGVAEDVSDIISMVSPYETPLLDRLSPPERPGENVLHEWLEESLGPNTIINSTGVTSDTANTGFQVAAGKIKQLAVGMILIGPAASGSEYMQIVSLSGNSVSVSRGFGGTTPNSIDANASIQVLGDVALEGADVTGDVSLPRMRVTNYMEIVKKDIIISGTVLAVRQLGNINDERAHQQEMRTREFVRDLEKKFIRGILSGNTLGTATAYRTAKGLRSFLATNAQSIGTLTESWLGNLLQACWDNGGTDVDLLACGVGDKRIIDSWNSTKLHVTPAEQRVYRNLITTYESAFGVQDVVLSRWIASSELFAISARRVKVVPLRTRSAHYEPIAKTGDSEKGMIIGEYTFEVKNEEAMGRKF